jgi:hypothetical protein
MSQPTDSIEVLLDVLEAINTVAAGVEHIDADNAIQMLMELKAMASATQDLVELTNTINNTPAPDTEGVQDPVLLLIPGKLLGRP